MSVLYTKGLKEEVRLGDLPTLRQAFFIASILIIAGYLLEYYVNPLFHWLPLLVAGGLMVSAIFGFCPMVYFLQKLPFNKKRYADREETV